MRCSGRSLLLFIGLTALACVPLAATSEPTGPSARLIEHFRMQKIPAEGAWFAGSYRSNDLLSAPAVDPRYRGIAHAAGSAIYALITPEDFSALHKLATDEIWHYYGGSAAELLLLYPDGHGEKVVLGPDVLAGQRPQIVVPRGVWQGAMPIESASTAYTLFGCTLAPGFEYGDFQIGYRDELQRGYPQFVAYIAQLTRSEFANKPAAAGTLPVAPSGIASTVFNVQNVAAIDAAPGTVLRELIGRKAKSTTSRYSVALFTLAPGTSMPTSYNKTAEETLLISSGTGAVALDSKAQKVAAGSIVVIAPGVRHSVRAAADSSLSFYAISAPAFSPDDYVLSRER